MVEYGLKLLGKMDGCIPLYAFGIWVWPMVGSNLNSFSNIMSTFLSISNTYGYVLWTYYCCASCSSIQENNMANAENKLVAILVIQKKKKNHVVVLR